MLAVVVYLLLRRGLRHGSRLREQVDTRIVPLLPRLLRRRVADLGGERTGARLLRRLQLALLRRLLVVVDLLQPDVPVGEVEGEERTLARIALDVDLAAEEPGDLPRDREPETGAAVLAAGGPVRLLEGLEDDLLLVLGDADAGVLDVEADHRAGREQRRGLEEGAVLHHLDPHRDASLLGELEGVGEEVLQDLLQALRVGANVRGDLRLDLDREIQPLLLGDRPEVAIDELLQVGDGDVARLDLHLARLDLAEVEDLVDEREEIAARGVDGLGVLDLLVGEVRVLVVREELGEDE